MTRGGRTKTREAPERRCIATGDSRPKAGLVRFVIGPDGQVVPDILERLPGRGIYVAADRAALDRAVAKRLFAKAARQKVAMPEGLVDTIEAALAARTVELISLARKAGAAVAGFEKAKAWLEAGRAAVLIQAADGSERGRAKLRPPPGEDGKDGAIDVLTAAELGLAFGREHVIHSALAGGGISQRVVEEAARLRGLRAGHGDERAPGRVKRPR